MHKNFAEKIWLTFKGNEKNISSSLLVIYVPMEPVKPNIKVTKNAKNPINISVPLFIPREEKVR